MIILCTVDITTREVTIPSDQRIASYDHKVDVIRFQVETIPGFSLDTSSIKIAAQGPNKARHDYSVDPSTVAIEEETGYITFDWPIPAGVTEMPIGTFKYGDRGQLIFAVCAEIISGSTVSKAWHSDDGIITVVAHLEPEAGGGEDPEEEATNAQKIAQLQTDVAVINTQVGALANGSPTPVATVAEMTDESAVYLYTGSETGYTAGNWYYYNGSAWTSGGTYGGATTSTTFNQHGVPADDFAVGEALADKADADDLTAIDTRTTAVEGDISDMSDMVDSIKENLTAETQVPLVYYAHKIISKAGSVSTYASYNAYNFDLTGIEKVSVTSRNNGKTKTRFIAFYSDNEGTSEALLSCGEFYDTYDETYYTEVMDVPEGAVSVFVVSDNSSPEPVVKKIYALDVGAAVDDINDSIETLTKTAEKSDRVFLDVEGEKVDLTLANGTVANANNTNAVNGSNAIPCVYGSAVTVYPVKPLTNSDGHYGYVYRIYDANGNILKDQSDRVTNPKIDISYVGAASIRVGILELDANEDYVQLRKESYGYVPYVIASNSNTLIARVDALEDTTNGTYEDLLSQARYSDTSGATHLTLLHFSDAHDNLACMTGAIELADKYNEKIDDLLHTGDTVLTNFSQGIAKWVSSGCAARAMNCIGNHDYYANSNLSMNDHASKADLYNTFLAPYVSGWGVTQPTGVDDSTSGDYCACYYYKDYATQGIRLIVLDSEQWDTAQLTWFTATLESARTAGYAVIVASHIPPGAVIGLSGSNFNHVTSPDLSAGTPTYATITEDASNAIDAFITAGGHFAVWLCGHYHRGGFGYVQNHPNIFVMSAEKAGTARTSGQARVNGERNANSYNLVSVDPTDHLIRLVRYGADVDGWLRGRHVFTYDYSAKTIISQW